MTANQVLDEVRLLVSELSGPDTARNVTSSSSFDAELGLGSLERAELLARLEKRAGRRLGEHWLSLDSADAIARALESGTDLPAGGAEPAVMSGPRPPSGTAAPQAPLRMLRLAITLPLFVLLCLALWAIAAVSPRRTVVALGRFGTRALALAVGWRLRARGLEHLPRSGPLVLVSNHNSNADILILMALLPRDFISLAKQEVLSWPIVGTFTRAGGHLSVDRYRPARSLAAGRAATAAVRDGNAVLFFPEGTFGPGDRLGPFRLGAFAAAAQTGAPIVPLVLRGTRAIQPPNARLPRAGDVELWAGPPIRAGGTSWRDIVALRDKVAAQIAAHA